MGMDRQQFIDLATSQAWSPQQVAQAAKLLDLRPTAADWRQFMLSLLRGVGGGLLCAGLVCFVAANWQDFGIWGRFALLQLAFAASAALAWWRPPPDVFGEVGCFLAAFLIGCLFALFGQHYQTGADVYELFLAWALFALPFAMASRSGATAALVIVVFNVGLALWANAFGFDGFIASAWGIESEQLSLAIVVFANLAVLAALWARGLRQLWLLVLPLMAGVVCASFACAMTAWGGSAAAWILFLVGFAALLAAARALSNALASVLPDTIAAAGVIVVSTILWVRVLFDTVDDGILSSFLIALWIGGCAAFLGNRLLARHRTFGAAA
jgi:uncharacterized membrane protein